MNKFRNLAAVATLAAMSLTAVTAEAFVIGPTTPGKWGPPAFGTGATVSYSYMSNGVDCSLESAGCTISAFGSFGPALAVWKSEVEAAMAAWAAVANLTFLEVPDLGEAFNAPGGSGDMRFGGHFFNGPGGVLAHGYYPPVNGDTAAGDMHFDTGDCWEAAFDGTGDGCFSIFQVAAHELGHALGLDHTGVPGSLMNPFYTEAFAGPQADDIAGMVFIYGPAVPPPPVPEPGSLALLALAFTATTFATRRRALRAGM